MPFYPSLAENDIIRNHLLLRRVRIFLEDNADKVHARIQSLEPVHIKTGRFDLRVERK